MSRRISGSSFRGNRVEVCIAGRGEKTGTRRLLLGVVGGGVLGGEVLGGSMVVIVGKGPSQKKKVNGGGNQGFKLNERSRV